jgi:hypothetical protein
MCKLWKNNLAHSPKLSGENVYERTGWSASASNNTNGARNALDGNPATDGIQKRFKLRGNGSW